jgi:hypothetical protein
MATYTETVVASPGVESSASAVSWGAIFVGAVVAAALSLLLLTIGSGLGLAAISPWQNEGASAESLGIGGAVWLAVMQLVSAAVGGYMAGRLRTKWVQLHTDEVFFRDTAHGFAVWAVGLVLTASVLASAATAVVGGVAGAGAAGASATAMAAGTAAAAAGVAGMQNGAGTSSAGFDPFAYVTDVLLRPADRSTTEAPAPSAMAPEQQTSPPVQSPDSTTNEAPPADTTEATGAPAASAPEQSAAAPAPMAELPTATPERSTSDAARDGATRAEFGRIFARSIAEGELAPADRAYIARVIGERTGISQAEAEQRINDAVATMQAAETKAREAADDARKAAAYTTLWIAVALLIGAFAASFAATIGGRQRDNVRYV